MTDQIWEEPVLALATADARGAMQIAWGPAGPVLGIHEALKPGVRWVTVTDAEVDEERGTIALTVDGQVEMLTRYFPAAFRRAES